MAQDFELEASKLRAVVDPSSLDFETTAELTRPQGSFGQDRAMAAIAFGCGMSQPGYNIFASGPTGSGRNTAILNQVKEIAQARPIPDDWCYVHNFDDPRRPAALRLRAGLAPGLASDVDALLAAVKHELPRSFESEAYEERKEQAVGDVQAERNRLLRELEQEARTQPTPMGVVTLPLAEGKPMSREQFEQLPEEERRELEARTEQFREKIADALNRARELEKEARRRVEELDRNEAMLAIGGRLQELKQRYQDHEHVIRFLDRMANDVVEHLDEFRAQEAQEEVRRPDQLPPSRYRVNVLVTNQETHGAPVIDENNPIYYNLLGRLEYLPVAGGAVTDFTLIKPGAIHRANGGFLIMQALDALTSPFVWDALKRVLRSREATIENIGEQFTPIPAAGLRPEPIPLDLKVILVGTPLIYFLLYYYDEEFRKLFKVRADFDVDMPADADATRVLADFLATHIREQDLRPFHREAVARMIEFAQRLAGDQGKLATRFSPLTDLLAEANFWAEQEQAEIVTAAHVERALEQKEYRSQLLHDRLFDYIARGDLRVDTDGAAVGQINGLAVLDTADYSFGRPSRITCRVTPGRAGVINLDREAQLAGSIHTKAVLILTGYLAGTYAAKAPLSLSASLSFEQSYDVVEGDSASCAEVYVILSALSGLPLRQDIAVTGSMDQYGTIQPIGGVNQKIEGFYTTCKLKGLTGRQGVMIPTQNVKNLMLKPEVIAAVESGQFHLWAVSHINQGIELLTGAPAGSPDEPDTVHGRVAARLEEFSNALRGQKEERTTIIAVPPGAATRPPAPPGPPVPPTRP
jgi:lon-related putative ATP-dependent protease